MQLFESGGYFSTKLASAIGGLIGGFVLMSFVRPQSCREAFIRGGVSVGTAIIFANPSLEIMSWPVNWETQLMSGMFVGFFAYFVLGAVANYFINHKNDDLIDLYHDATGKERRVHNRRVEGRGGRRSGDTCGCTCGKCNVSNTQMKKPKPPVAR